MRAKPSWSKFLSLLLVFLVLEVIFMYTVQRHEQSFILGLFSGMFLLYAILILGKEIDTSWIIWSAVIARLVIFLAEPNLSDDYYRFIWDGRLINAGINPFLFKPSFYMNSSGSVDGLTPDLYNLLNSPDYFTIYPPISQWAFALSTYLSPQSTFGSVLVMRSVIILADLGAIVLLSKVLMHYQKSTRFLLAYALNPLVILELTGNLHFEALMIFFLLLAIWLLITKREFLSALAMALSISTKLFPLMLLPGLYDKIAFKRLVWYYLITGIVVASIFVLTLDIDFFLGLGDSLSLFFQKFEFNGGIFFLLREIGFWYSGYDLVQVLGPSLAVLAMTCIVLYTFTSAKKQQNLGLIFTTILFTQLSLATTVHPWYVIPLLVMGCISGLYFPIIWSFLIFLTYWGYSISGYDQPFFLMAVEYIIVIPLAVYELIKRHQNIDKALA